MPRGPKFKFTEEDITKFAYLYYDGMNIEDVAKIAGVTSKSLYENFKRFGVETFEEARVNFKPITTKCIETDNSTYEDYFDIIDTERKAYWLGMLAGDGYIREDNGTVRLKLKEIDAHHVLLFKEHLLIESNGWWETSDGFKSFAIQTRKCYPLTSRLASLGCGQRKSFTASWPEELPFDLERHFLRGLMDSDGSWYINDRSAYNRKPAITYQQVGSIPLLEVLSEKLKKACMLDTATVKPVKAQKGNFARIMIRGIPAARKIFEYLYTDSTVWLPRKREIVETFLENIT